MSNKVGKVSGFKPVGNQILVEFLTNNEVLGTKLHLGGSAPKTIPQGYVLLIGPRVDPQWGVAVGDRVIVTGTYTPLPEFETESNREVGCVEPHAIKAVVAETPVAEVLEVVKAEPVPTKQTKKNLIINS